MVGKVIVGISIFFSGCAIFEDSKCYGRNGKVFLKWSPPDSLVENYMLEVKSEENSRYVCVYIGPECQYTVHDIKYGCSITARIKAVNSAGTGNVSEELSVLMPQGKKALLSKVHN